MDRRLAAALALAAVFVLAGCTAGYQAEVPERSEPPTEDDLGYYDGYWHDDTFDIDAADGLTRAERHAVFSRSMARIQLLRGLEFEHRVDIELVTREEFRAEYGDRLSADPEPGIRALDNAQHEALFLVGPDEDVFEVRRNNRGDAVLGFYQPSQERIVIVSRNDPATLDDEITLAHELLHALQDQRFDLASLDGGTLDAVNARNGLVEGDAVAVENEYEQRCETGEWQCVDAETSGTGGIGDSFHFGVYFVGFFPYAEGPTFINHHREAGDWEAINRMYENQPTASAEIIYPETYDADAYGEATLDDRSTDEWERIETDNGDHATVGQAGLTAMFAYTVFEDRSRAVIDIDEFRNVDGGSLDTERPFRYDVSYAEGWYADRLYAYDDGEESAFVWNVTFNDAANAIEFREGYEAVFEFWGGERAEPGVWRFDPATEPFRGAVWVERDGNTVMVVKAPDSDALDDVHAPAG